MTRRTRTTCESVHAPGPLVSWAAQMCRRPWPCNCRGSDEPVPDEGEFIRKKWEYARKIDALTKLVIAAGPDWMR
jgi:hypothetical protein